MKEIRLSKGSHDLPFDEAGNATMCVQEYVSYLAGESHSDTPVCVSPVLTRFMISFNDSLDHEMRQRLRPYAVRQIGTRDDGQDEVRSYMALDWIIRTHLPVFLKIAGFDNEANELHALSPIKEPKQVETIRSKIELIVSNLPKETSPEFLDQGHGCYVAGTAVWTAARIGIWSAANAASTVIPREIITSIVSIFWDVVKAAAQTAIHATDAYALNLHLVNRVHESAFELLERMIDPAGVHDIKSEEFWTEQTGRELLV